MLVATCGVLSLAGLYLIRFAFHDQQARITELNARIKDLEAQIKPNHCKPCFCDSPDTHCRNGELMCKKCLGALRAVGSEYDT